MQYPQLLWLLQLRGGEAGAAAGALMQSAGLHKVCPWAGLTRPYARPGLCPPRFSLILLITALCNCQAEFAHHRRLVCLAKLAAHAAPPPLQAEGGRTSVGDGGGAAELAAVASNSERVCGPHEEMLNGLGHEGHR